MNLKAGDLARVAFSAPCCGSSAKNGERVEVLEIKQAINNATEGTFCVRCLRPYFGVIALTRDARFFLGWMPVVRLVRIPPDEEIQAQDLRAEAEELRRMAEELRA